MKQFLKSNTITYNLMSFTGFKSILIFSMLIDGPKSYKDMQEIIMNHEYLKEKLSVDTLRVYLNSLREIGCQIDKTNIHGITKFSISSHPFYLKITDSQARSIIKIYKAISKSIDVNDLYALQKFFYKISAYIGNDKLKTKLQNLSPLNNINPKIIEDLKIYAQNNNEITVLYRSVSSGKKNITILVDKMTIMNGRLYVCGVNSAYNNYARFLVSRILDIVSVNINSPKLDSPDIVAGYELLKTGREKPEILDTEKIIKEFNDKYLIEITTKNKFDIIQRVMSHSSKCKLLYPEAIKEEVISNLKRMKEGYLDC